MRRPGFETVVIALIFISLAAKFFLIPFNQGMWWDEAVYLGLGRSVSQGFYGLEVNTTLEVFRPPLFPLVVSPFYASPAAARFFVAIISVIAIFCIYLLGREMFDRRTGLVAALLTSAGFHFIFFSIKALSEPLLMVMVSLSLLFFHRWTTTGRGWQIYLAGMFAALAFLTRYFGAILLVSYLVYFLVSKRKDTTPLKLLSVYLLVLVPWLVMNQAYYGNPAGAIFSNLGFYAKEIVFPLERVLDEVLLALGPLIVLLPAGVLSMARDRRKMVLIFFLFISLAFFLALHHKEPRYLLSFYPVYAVIGARGFEMMRKVDRTKLLAPALLLVLTGTMLWGLQASWVDREAASGLVSAAQELKALTSEGEVILAQSYPYVYYFSERRGRKFPVKEEDVVNVIGNYSINYALYHKFEEGNPEYAENYFRRFEPVRTFEEWGDPEAVVIYRINSS